MYPTKKLWEIWVYINWKAFKPSDWWKSGFPIVRIQNLNWNWEYNFFYWEIEEKYFIEKWDILISWSASLDIYIWKWEKSVLNQHIFKVDLNEKIIERTFFYYLIKNILKEIISKTHWVWMKHITKWKFESILIPLPPLPIQQKIVFKLDSSFEKLDKAIILTRQNLASIEELNKSILEKIFKECEGKYEKKKLEEVCEIWPKKSELNNLDWKLEVAFVPMKYLNEKEKFFEYEEVKILDEVRWWYTYFTENDVLLAKVTPCFENWKSWIAKNLLNKIWFGSSEFYVFRANEKVLPEWIYYIITSENFLKNWKNNMSGAVWLKRVTKNFIENFQIPLPPLSEQQKIVEYLDNIFAKNKILQEKYKQDLKNFEELKQSILKQAFEDEDFIK